MNSDEERAAAIVARALKNIEDASLEALEEFATDAKTHLANAFTKSQRERNGIARSWRAMLNATRVCVTQKRDEARAELADLPSHDILDAFYDKTIATLDECDRLMLALEATQASGDA